MAVSDYEKKIDSLKTEHDKSRDILHSLIMQRDNELSRTSFPEQQKLLEDK